MSLSRGRRRRHKVKFRRIVLIDGYTDNFYAEFHDMDHDVMLKALSILSKRGKAQVFGSEGQEGVKFF